MSCNLRRVNLLADPVDREEMAYSLAKRVTKPHAAERMGVSEDELLKLIAGYLRRFPACRNVDNLLGGV